ncbi:unnamed protein product [Ectocarpus sp. CCAP 1310/34]|nr:unnamed protein product [Ectocarpus sp. CCAP 1310/34]
MQPAAAAAAAAAAGGASGGAAGAGAGTATTSCRYPGCPKRPTYGIEASRRRECCAVHALPGMVNIDLTR